MEGLRTGGTWAVVGRKGNAGQDGSDDDDDVTMRRGSNRSGGPVTGIPIGGCKRGV